MNPLQIKILKFAQLILFALFLYLASVAPICWIVRDGLGPNSGPSSTGIHAVFRFLSCFYWGPAFLTLVIAQIFLTVINRKWQS